MKSFLWGLTVVNSSPMYQSWYISTSPNLILTNVLVTIRSNHLKFHPQITWVLQHKQLPLLDADLTRHLSDNARHIQVLI